MHSTQSMMESSMVGTRVYQFCQAHLLDSSESLKIGVIDDVKYQLTPYGDEPINRVVDNLSFVQVMCFNSLKFEPIANFE